MDDNFKLEVAKEVARAVGNFYAYTQIVICLLATLVLFSIWRKIRYAGPEKKVEDYIKRDYGLVWIALAMFSWAFIPIIEIFLKNFGEIFKFKDTLRIILSTFNDFFLLLAVSFFEYGPKKEYKIFNKDISWTKLVLIGTTIFLISELSTINKDITIFNRGYNLAYGTNILLTLITFIFLGISLIKTFWKRDFKPVSIFTCLALLIAFLSQLPYIYPFIPQEGYIDFFIRLNYKLSFIPIFFALAISWYVERVYLTKMDKIYLKFAGQIDGKWTIFLTIPGLYENKEIHLIGYLHEALLKLAVARKKDQRSEGGWLGLEELYYYAYITKLCNSLRLSQRNILIENDYRGKYRLRIAPDNIEINEELKSYPNLKKILS